MPEFGLIRIVAVLLLVVGMIVVCGWLAKRSGLAGVSGKGTPMRVSARMPMGPRSHVVVLDLEDARLVLGVTPSAINLLHTLGPGEQPPVSAHASGATGKPVTFQSIFRQIAGAKDRSTP